MYQFNYAYKLNFRCESLISVAIAPCRFVKFFQNVSSNIWWNLPGEVRNFLDQSWLLDILLKLIVLSILAGSDNSALSALGSVAVNYTAVLDLIVDTSNEPHSLMVVLY